MTGEGDDPQATNRVGLILGAGVIALAGMWTGFAVWLVLTADSLVAIAPLLTTVAAAVLPPLLLLLVWIVARRPRPAPGDAAARLYVEALAREADASLGQVAAAEARLAGAPAALRRHLGGAALDLGGHVEDVLNRTRAVEAQCERVNGLIDATGDSAANALALVNALEAAAPRMDRRLADLAASLAGNGEHLAAQGTLVEERMQGAALAAEEARLQLTALHDAALDRVDALRTNARDAAELMDMASETASARVELALERSRTALAETHDGLDRQHAGLVRLTEDSRAAIAVLSDEAATGFAARADALATRLAAMDAALTEQRGRGEAMLVTLGTGIDTLATDLAALDADAAERTARMADAIGRLARDMAGFDAALGQGNAHAVELIRNAESLLLALDSNIRELDESLPAALARVDGLLGRTHAQLGRAVDLATTAADAADGVAGRLDQAGAAVAAHGDTLARRLADADGDLDRQRRGIADMAAAMVTLRDMVAHLLDQALPQAAERLRTIGETADNAARDAGATIDRVVEDAAARLETASGAVLESAIGDKVNEQVAQIATIADNAVKSAHRATDHLMRQMIALTDSATAFESRVADAARNHEDRGRDFLAERSAQIIAALNSNAIDISRALSSDIGEREWAAYLNGDKSLFTRRAVKLLGNGEARQVLAQYHDDAAFQEHVNRYIQDFEAMLRDILASTSGHSLAIAVLSSDLGRLYVALAQATERLRVA